MDYERPDVDLDAATVRARSPKPNGGSGGWDIGKNIADVIHSVLIIGGLILVWVVMITHGCFDAHPKYELPNPPPIRKPV